MRDRLDLDAGLRQAIHDQNMKDIGAAYLGARNELVALRTASAQVRRFFRYDAATRTWSASIQDDEIALLKLGDWFHPHGTKP